MTKEELKVVIDQEVTNKTQRSSITPTIMGNTLKIMVDNLAVEGGGGGGITPDDIGPSLHIDAESKLNTGSDPSLYSPGTVSLGGSTYNFTYVEPSILLALDPTVTDLSTTSHIAVTKKAVDVGGNIVEVGSVDIVSNDQLGLNIESKVAQITMKNGAGGIILTANQIGLGVPEGGNYSQGALYVNSDNVYVKNSLSISGFTSAIGGLSAVGMINAVSEADLTLGVHNPTTGSTVSILIPRAPGQDIMIYNRFMTYENNPNLDSASTLNTTIPSISTARALINGFPAFSGTDYAWHTKAITRTHRFPNGNTNLNMATMAQAPDNAIMRFHIHTGATMTLINLTGITLEYLDGNVSGITSEVLTGPLVVELLKIANTTVALSIVNPTP